LSWTIRDRVRSDPGLRHKAAVERIKKEEEQSGIRVSSISVWEIAVTVLIGKRVLPLEIGSWFFAAKSYPGL
jgi:PIN domain nuclease of toxin-antitoxin system